MSKLTFSPVMKSPLNHFNLIEKQQPIDASKGVWANEIPLLGYISLRGNAQNALFIKAAKKALGVALPILPCSLISTSWGCIYLLSPDEWLLVCDRELRAELQQKLEAALVDNHSQVIDNSGGFTTVFVQGKNASDLLHHCTVYNLNALTLGKIVGTTFGKTSVFLHQHGNGYNLIFRRSFADYIWRYLERSALPYGFGIANLGSS